MADMIVAPAQALTLLARFQPISAGDLLLTGTPGGTALKAPAKALGKLAGLLPPATRWRLFSSGGRRATPGTCATATSSPRRSLPPTGGWNLGTQHNTVIGKTP